MRTSTDWRGLQLVTSTPTHVRGRQALHLAHGLGACIWVADGYMVWVTRDPRSGEEPVMDPYPAARLASYLNGRVPKLSLQLPACCVNFMGPGEHDEASRCGHDLGCLGRQTCPSQPHGQSWPGTLGHNSRHLPTITISGSNAQPSRRCGDQQ